MIKLTSKTISKTIFFALIVSTLLNFCACSGGDEPSQTNDKQQTQAQTKAPTVNETEPPSTDPAETQPEPDYKGQDGDYTYEVFGNDVYITSYKGEETQISLPAAFGEYTVTAIADGAFKGNETITSVVIPSGYTAIGPSAFADCKSLQSASLP
ncbi:MAG: leucine-rich repeat protein, partial [Clostridia bacterium]|nr:leucine-rich repeat protein [Clostridia bacterium]